MTANAPQCEMITWAAPECPFRVECAPAVLERIRLAVTDAFFALPHGGLEIGGLLFGSRGDGYIAIQAFRPLNCEHAQGPSFLLSRADLESLAGLLRTSGAPGFEGLEPLGWYHSHTRSGISLSAADVEIHRRFFPEPWQVALVVRPHVGRPTQAGFFFRKEDGTLCAERSGAEFTLTPVALPEGPEPEPAPAATPENTPFDPPVLATAHPSILPPVVSRVRPPVSVWAGLAAFILLGGGAVFLAGDRSIGWHAPTRIESISLRCLDRAGQLEVFWDRSAPAVQRATAARLEVSDGGSKRAVDVDAERLRGGSFTLARRSERVDVRMVLREPGKPALQELTTFLGAPPVRHPSDEELELMRQRDLAMSDLRAQIQRNRRLERTLHSLRTQLDKERTAKEAAAEKKE